MILAIFDLQVTLMLPTKFKVNWPFGSGEAKNKFSRWPPWQPSWISDRNNFSNVTMMLLPSFKSIGLSVQEKKRKIDFQDGRHGSHLGFPIITISAIVNLQVTFLLSLESIGLGM